MFARLSSVCVVPKRSVSLFYFETTVFLCIFQLSRGLNMFFFWSIENILGYKNVTVLGIILVDDLSSALSFIT